MRQYNKYLIFLLFLGFSSTGSWAADSFRGRLIGAEKMPTWGWSQKALKLAKVQMKLDPTQYPTRSRVDVYRLRFETLNQKKEFVASSGIVLVPSDIRTPLPILSYQHGTRFSPKDAASMQRFDPEAQMAAIFFASDCCLVSMPDYLGLGIEAQGPQFYMTAEIQAMTSVDMLRAAQSFFKENNIAATENLLITGYSQGAHNSLALQKYLQQVDNHGFKIVGTSAMGGLYDLSGVTRDILKFEAGATVDPALLSLAILGLHEAYDYFPRFNQILAEPYASTLPAILKKANFREIARLLPPNLNELFNMPYVAGILSGNNDHPFWRALAHCDVYNFVPIAPLLLVYSPSDNVLPKGSTESAIKKMEALAVETDVKVTIEVKKLDEKWFEHLEAALPSLIETHTFFKKILK